MNAIIGSGAMPQSMKALIPIIKNFLGKDSNLVIEYSYLRAEQVLKNNSNTYNFQIRQGNTIPTLTERLLQQNDVFMAAHIGIQLTACENTKRSAAVLQTYPNPQVFTASGTGNLGDLEAIYNADFRVTINTKNIYSQIPTHSMRYVPVTQQSATLAKSEMSAYDGLVDVGLLKFSGLDQIELVLSITPFESATPAWEATTPNFENRLNLVTYGFLIKGAAQAVSKSNLPPNMNGC